MQQCCKCNSFFRNATVLQINFTQMIKSLTKISNEGSIQQALKIPAFKTETQNLSDMFV